ncbi:MAG: hypothetical protein ACETWG_11400 [Candidatus Neomarinimicrobiota bacterium]
MDEAKKVIITGIPERINQRQQAALPVSRWVLLASLVLGFLGCLILGLGEDTVLLILSLVIYGLSAYVLVRQAGGLIITPTTLFFLLFTIFTYIGGLILFFSNGEGVSYGGGDRNYTFYLVIHMGILALVLGVLFAAISFRFSPRRELNLFRRTPWRDVHDLPGDTIFIALVGIVALFMSMWFMYSRGTLPLIEALMAQGRENVYELAVTARAEYSRYGRGAGQYFYQGYFQQFYIVILPFVTIYVGSKYLHYRRAGLLILWIVLGIITTFFLTMSLQRWPLMFFVIMNYVVYASYIGRIRVAHALFFAIVTLALFSSLTYIRGSENLAIAMHWVVTRIFMVNVDVLYSILEMFPEHFAFFGGQAILSDLKGLLPGPNVGFTRWLFDALYRVYGNGTASTMLWGELYADFGLGGVWISSLLVGFVMQSVYITFIRGRKNLLRLVLYTFLFVASGLLAIGGLVGIIIQFGIVTLLLLIAALNTMRWVLSAGPIITAQTRALPSFS